MSGKCLGVAADIHRILARAVNKLPRFTSLGVLPSPLSASRPHTGSIASSWHTPQTTTGDLWSIN